MKYALILKYLSLEGIEHAIDFLPMETAEQRASSLKLLQENSDFVGFLSDEQITTLEGMLAEGATATEAMDIEITAENYPLFIVANAARPASDGAREYAGALQLSEGFTEINSTEFNEAPMCDNGPSRKETLKHAREAFRQIGALAAFQESLATLPTLLESFGARLTALETNNPVPQAAAPPTEETPATESTELTTETPVVETPTEEAAPNADVPSEEADTPIAAVVVESPLEEEGITPPSQLEGEVDPAGAGENEPETTETPVLSGAARSSLRRLSQHRKVTGVTL